ncbi:MAG: ABC transporter substrate-binding protein [Gammaproteobacteria bacterium]|nr:ABC transporter substrate-binding protein [Gammaproteobacteria bacterium]
MKRYLATALVAVLALLPSIGTSSPPTKILSLDLCSDWLLAKYADRSQVVALSPLLKQYPVKWIADEWPIHDGSLEQILQLKPDLILSGEFNALILRQRLISLGFRVEILALPRTLPEVVEYEQRFLSLVGLPITQASQPPPTTESPRQPARLLLLGANGIGTGQQTFENDVIKRAGWGNYLETDGYSTLDLEQLVSDPPDAVMWSAPKSPALANQFAKHPALRHAIPGERWLSSSYWHWQCPGPWTWQLIKQLQEQRTEWSG